MLYHRDGHVVSYRSGHVGKFGGAPLSFGSQVKVQGDGVEKLELLVGMEQILVGGVIGIVGGQLLLQAALSALLVAQHGVDLGAQLVGNHVQEDLVAQPVPSPVQAVSVHRRHNAAERVMGLVERWRARRGGHNLSQRGRRQVVGQAGVGILRSLGVEVGPTLVVVVDNELHGLGRFEAVEFVVAEVGGQRTGERGVLVHGDHEMGSVGVSS